MPRGRSRARPIRGPLSPKSERAELTIAAHMVFDRIWKRDRRAPDVRRAAYRWLAEQLGLSSEACHFAVMSEPDLRRAIQICRGIDAGYIVRWSMIKARIARASGQV